MVDFPVWCCVAVTTQLLTAVINIIARAMRMPEGGRRRQLASLDWLGDTNELRARAEEALRQSEPVGRPERPQGSDESGSISVTVDARGWVVDVAVDRQWRERLEAGRFAEAVLEAYTAAVKASIESAALAALADDQDAEPGAPATATPAIDPDLEGHDWLHAVWAVLDANRAASRQLSAIDAPDRHQRTLSSPRGFLTLHIRGQGLERITGDVRRIAVADAAQLRQDALVALQAIAPSRDPSNESGRT
jgi:hypothetical protein